MSRSIRTLCLSLIVAALTVVPLQSASSTPPQAPPDRAQSEPAQSDPAQSDRSEQALIAEADASVALTRAPATGEVATVRVAAGGDLAPTDERGPTAKAEAWVRKHGDAFGAATGEMQQVAINRHRFGTTVTFEQQYQGLPVFGAQVKVNLDETGALTSANGFAAPDLELSISPEISSAVASQRALDEVRADPPSDENGKSDTAGIRALTPRLMVYRVGSVKGLPGAAELTWQVEVTNRANVQEMLFISAVSGKPLNRYSMIHSALDRRLSSGNTTTPIWREGDAFPGNLSAEGQGLIQGASDAYWFFANAMGRDSYDAAGAPMSSVVAATAIPCPNATWDGASAQFCTGVASDDIVAHEWAHAYTEYTSGLIYQWQSGALNESYSDIWGETIDLLNAREDADEGNLTAPRAVGSCGSSAATQPLLTINSPAVLARSCETRLATYGPSAPAGGITANAVAALDDSGEAPGTFSDGCTPYTNPADVVGKIVIVDSSPACSAATQTSRAQAAGAAALVIGVADLVAPGGPATGVTIPTVVTNQVHVGDIRQGLLDGAVTLTLSDATRRQDSHRWLIGEKSPAVGGTIRDMWSPRCYGNPGKVSDAEYFCGTQDNGGVHLNSGIPNRGYTLLVDGGTDNGVAVTGVGLNKAAAIYWLAQVRTTPIAGFADHADLLQAACTDLVGQSVPALSVTPNATPASGGTITTSNCASVAAMINAVELREEPTQCQWLRQLAAGAPPTCGIVNGDTVLFSDGFEAGLSNWTVGGTARYVGGQHIEWESVARAPGGRTGKVAYAPDPNAGNCVGASGSLASTDWLQAPVTLTVPRLGSATLTFDHYIATEATYDGGVVQMSRNGGSWSTIPSSAYTYNAPTRTLRTSATSDNPLAGQRAFEGTDQGGRGSWGTSRIDFGLAGALPDEQVRIRFNFGRDTCGGLDGWYVDNVVIALCQPKVRISATHSPEPSTYFSPSKLTLTVAPAGDSPHIPTGELHISSSNRAFLPFSAQLAAGRVVFQLWDNLPAGTYPLRLAYSGDGNFAAQVGTATFTVRGAPTTIRVLNPRKVQFRENFWLSARVRSLTAGVSATGMVRFYDGKKYLGQGRISGTVSKVRVKKNLKRGRHKIRAVYVGSATTTGSQTVWKLRVR